MYFFMMLFRGPFWIQFILAAGLVWLGIFIQNDETNRLAARAALLKQAPPATISIADAHPGKPSRVPVELALTAQISTEHNTRLITKTNFIKTGESQLYVLVDPSPGADPNVAKAAIVIDPDDREAFVAWVIENTTDMASDHPITTINGLLEHSSSDSHAREAMQKQGMTIAPGLFFIEPFFRGREAALTANTGSGTQIAWPIFLVAAVFALIGLVKAKSPRRPKPDPMPAPQKAASAPSANSAIEALGLAEVTMPAWDAARGTATKAVKPPMAKSRKIMLLLGGAFIAALIAGQSWAYAILPVAILGLMYLGMRSGLRTAGQQLGSVFDRFADNSAPSAMPSTAQNAAVPIKSAQKDDGPIRSGFSLKDLLPRPKQKTANLADPFERLAQQRQRQDRNSSAR